MKLSIDGARTLLLEAQGVNQSSGSPVSKAQVLETIRRMGLLQIDTISVVARSPYLVLWSRLGAYEPRLVDDLHAGGALFEYWSHAACFLPIDDFPIYRRLMLEFAERNPYVQEDHPEYPANIGRVLEHIRERGAVKSAEFERQGSKSNGWWDWKPEKLALERLYFAGILMIARREGFQRVYDLRERVLPDWDDSRTPSLAEGARTMTLKAVQALGVAIAPWVTAYFPDYLRKRTGKATTAAILESLADEGALVRVEVEEWNSKAYIHPDNLAMAALAADGALRSEVTTLLSPFDPIVSDRDRARKLFGFDYTIETYTPAERRRFGYFTLPILHRGALVGRLDPKAHRKSGLFEVRALHLEPETRVTDSLVIELAETLRACAAWHATPNIVVQRSDPPDLAGRLQALLH